MHSELRFALLGDEGNPVGGGVSRPSIANVDATLLDVVRRLEPDEGFSRISSFRKRLSVRLGRNSIARFTDKPLLSRRSSSTTAASASPRNQESPASPFGESSMRPESTFGEMVNEMEGMERALWSDKKKRKQMLQARDASARMNPDDAVFFMLDIAKTAKKTTDNSRVAPAVEQKVTFEMTRNVNRVVHAQQAQMTVEELEDARLGEVVIVQNRREYFDHVKEDETGNRKAATHLAAMTSATKQKLLKRPNTSDRTVTSEGTHDDEDELGHLDDTVMGESVPRSTTAATTPPSWEMPKETHRQPRYVPNPKLQDIRDRLDLKQRVNTQYTPPPAKPAKRTFFTGQISLGTQGVGSVQVLAQRRPSSSMSTVSSSSVGTRSTTPDQSRS